ncbi:uncharacterized protein BDR25DRAFT_97385 [Lindgomyces ingoldianus]|uniref:Uncharacterized protein n=1 Tax=Lindgomyces ingoldianus TaxID=673940 RepID=A0ACB6QDK5_9PLEO|nr:uncharacterized protein BDR25DRAFT_97385 [Lindgomyces ingoldianus]KAF2464225.1 hypothetical protein BDR25DRAFT_97385 [Lindgomyces ingoldianus]
MAEPVSSIVTLTAVSLTIIRRTVRFIQAARTVDTLIESLLTTLLDLKRLLRVVESTCRQATSGDDDPSRFVKDSVVRCHNRLTEVQAMVEGLAFREKRTLFQKVVLLVRTDRSRKDIEDAIQDIDRLMNNLHRGISSWNLLITSAIHRRASEAPPFRLAQITTTSTESHEIEESDAVSPLSRAWSEVETVYDASVSSRRSSSATGGSRNSISSTSFRARQPHSERSSSVSARIELVPQNSEWVDFHYQIKACKGNEARIKAIRKVLQEHPDSTTLANSPDGSRRTPLHLVAQQGDVKLAEILVAFTANINAIDSQPRSVLDFAVKYNHEHFVEFLIDHNVDQTAIAKENLRRFREIKDTIDFQKIELGKIVKKERKRNRTNTST